MSTSTKKTMFDKLTSVLVDPKISGLIKPMRDMLASGMKTSSFEIDLTTLVVSVISIENFVFVDGVLDVHLDNRYPTGLYEMNIPTVWEDIPPHLLLKYGKRAMGAATREALREVYVGDPAFEGMGPVDQDEFLAARASDVMELVDLDLIPYTAAKSSAKDWPRVQGPPIRIEVSNPTHPDRKYENVTEYPTGLIVTIGAGKTGKTRLTRRLAVLGEGKPNVAYIAAGEPEWYSTPYGLASLIGKVFEQMKPGAFVIVDSMKQLTNVPGASIKEGLSRTLFDLMHVFNDVAQVRGCTLMAVLNPMLIDQGLITLIASSTEYSVSGVLHTTKLEQASNSFGSARSDQVLFGISLRTLDRRQYKGGLEV